VHAASSPQTIAGLTANSSSLDLSLASKDNLAVIVGSDGSMIQTQQDNPVGPHPLNRNQLYGQIKKGGGISALLLI
jgi:photosystem II stability/assembly factor-like uncharacterized protein